MASALLPNIYFDQDDVKLCRSVNGEEKFHNIDRWSPLNILLSIDTGANN
jgi:hypothetical protein